MLIPLLPALGVSSTPVPATPFSARSAPANSSPDPGPEPAHTVFPPGLAAKLPPTIPSSCALLLTFGATYAGGAVYAPVELVSVDVSGPAEADQIAPESSGERAARSGAPTRLGGERSGCEGCDTSLTGLCFVSISARRGTGTERETIPIAR